MTNEEIFNKLAKKYHKTNVQVILRWHLQEINIFIPKSSNPAHIMDNFNIFDFDPLSYSQYYHPPLHHLISAVFIKICLKIVHNIEQKFFFFNVSNIKLDSSITTKS